MVSDRDSHGHVRTPMVSNRRRSGAGSIQVIVIFRFILEKMLAGRYSCAFTVITVGKSGKWVG